MNINRLLKVAETVSNKSNIRVKVACLLVDKRGGNVVATGYNHLGIRLLFGRHSVHAEIEALKKVKKPSSNLIMFIYRKGLKPIHPCPGCMEWIRAYGIREVILMHELKIG